MILAKLTSFFWLVLISGGCNDQSMPSQSIPDDTLITLQRSVCFGACPDYKLTISADGTVTFEGHQFVRVKGKAKKMISPAQLRQLIAEFEKAKYFSLKDKYEGALDGCPEVWTDNPSVVTSIRIKGKSKSISHYYGCQEGRGSAIYPKALTDLESKIDEIVGTKQWIE